MNTPDTAEQSLWLLNLLLWAFPYFAYFLGVTIRKVTFPGEVSQPLAHQFLLAVPVCLVVVSPLLGAVQSAVVNNWPSYLFSLGMIILHGMLMHETAVKYLQAHKGKIGGAAVNP